MNKLLLSGVGALALVAMSVGSASAVGFGFGGLMSSTSNTAVVSNHVNVSSNTGDNYQKNVGESGGGLFFVGNSTTTGSNSMITGPAQSEAYVITEANNGCGCEGGGLFMDKTTNKAFVMNHVNVDSNTGDNTQKNYGTSSGGFLGLGSSTTTGSNSMATGGAFSGAQVWTVVNSSMTLTE